MPSSRASPAGQSPGRDVLERTKARTTQNTPLRDSGSGTLNRAKLDIGKAQGLYDTAGIREKVAKWQTCNTDAPPDGGRASNRIRDGSPERPGQRTPTYDRSDARDFAKGANLAPPKSRPSPTKTPTKHNKVDADIRAASMPKKRLVSDEHWKKTRTPPKASQPNNCLVTVKEAPPSKVLDVGVMARPGSNTCDAWIRPKTSPVKNWKAVNDLGDVTREAKDPGESKHTPQAHKANTAEDGMGAPEADRLHKSTMHRKAKSAGDVEAQQAGAKVRTRNEDHSPDGNPARGVNKSFKPALEFFAGRMPPGGHRSPRQPADISKDDPKDRPRKAGNLMNGAPQPAPGGRIQSWLGTTPDPFIEDFHTLAKGARAAPSLQDLKVRMSKSDTEDTPTSDHKPTQREGRRVQRRQQLGSEARDPDILPEFDHRQLSSGAEEDDSPARTSRLHFLKRSGAKRNMQSPKKKCDDPKPDAMQPPAAPSTIFSGLESVAPDDSASMVVPRKKPEYLQVLDSPQRRKSDMLTSRQTSPQLYSSPFQNQALVPTNQDRAMTILAKDETNSDTIDQTAVARRPSLKRKVTSHADLMSVLSEPADAGQTLKSACSVRYNRTKPGQATFEELLLELKTDELKYMRELRTLIDGVIPVLLSCVLSKENASTATAFFSSKGSTANVTTPIVNMGVALERLRSCHKRLPLDSPKALMTWASHAHRVYADYIRAWRMGFLDVVVNLAPADDCKAGGDVEGSGLAQDTNGDVINDEGDKVDVSFLLKRPLVRIKHLSKTLKSLATIYNTQENRDWAGRYQGLVNEARDRQNEERGRLEDEAAASIDVTRARDPSTLAPLAGVQIDPHGCVRARDIFDLKLCHSTGQRLDCRVELILRDCSNGDATNGDVLVCEVDNASRWLLLPPLQQHQLSARHGTGKGEIVVMVRGSGASGRLWQELLCLQPEDEEAGPEWLKMLASDPIPPEVNAGARLLTQSPQHTGAPQVLRGLYAGLDSRPTSPIEVDIPLGEQASVISRHWGSRPSSRDAKRETPSTHVRDLPSTPTRKAGRSERIESSTGSPRSLNEAMRNAGSVSREPHGSNVAREHYTPRTKTATPATPNSDYQRMSRFAKHEELSDVGGSTVSLSRPGSPSATSNASKGYSVWLPQQNTGVDEEDEMIARGEVAHDSGSGEGRASPITRHGSPALDKTQEPGAGSGKIISSTSPSSIKRKEVPRTASRSPSPSTPARIAQSPQTPQRSAMQLRGASTPQFTPPSSGPRGHRRSSSPLKHEYAPSLSSDDSPDARELLDDDDDMSISSASSADDIVPSLPPMGLFNNRKKRPDSAHSPNNPATVAPSQSASQTPMQNVLDEVTMTDRKIASIFCWSEEGTWDSLCPDECSIVVSPGLIEAFAMSSAHSGIAGNPPSSPSSPFFSSRPEGIAPLIGLELTPLVPLRRGTAIDISIRSPPTPISTVKASTNNIMFRSRNNLECEHLYNAINHARINNPTYIALQNARPGGNSNWSAYMDGRSNATHRPSWWRLGRRRSSYRATSSRRTSSSVAGVTEGGASVATMSTAISALKRFSAGSKVFNVAKSTVTSRGGVGLPGGGGHNSRSSATFSSSSGGGIPSGASTPPAGVGVGLDPALGTPLGIRDAKIRLYAREAAGKWRDMGSARLTIMQPPRPAGAPPPLGPDGRLRQEKRVVILGKTKGETLLDVTAGEGSFERVARTGIAVSVWERSEEVGKRGGVAGVKVNVFMVQMRSEAEAAYTFSLVGRLRF